MSSKSSGASSSTAYKALRPVLVLWPAAGLVAGLTAVLSGYGGYADVLWAVATIPVALVLAVEIVTSLRRGDVGLDIVAFISMTAALAFGENLAGVVVALMYAGGQYLESFAEGRARREMTALLARVPRTAMRYRDGRLEEVDLEAIAPGDRLLVRTGDIIPVDGAVASGVAVLDESALTGESVPVRRKAGESIMSGSTNCGDVFDLAASTRARESTFARIVRMVEAAQQIKAPMARLADRFAIVFLAGTLTLAGSAWLWSGDPIRALSVLVVATPCPLILAVPVAIVAGMSRAAKSGVLIKGGGALEMLARARTLILDKTGTITLGIARFVAAHLHANVEEDELLRLSASLDQASPHVIANALVSEARRRGLALAIPSAVTETPGDGVEGVVEGHSTVVGGVEFVRSRVHDAAQLPESAHAPGALVVAVGLDGRLAGALTFADPVRGETEGLLRDLRECGLERLVLASGDRREVVDAIGNGLPFDALHGELSPEQKIALVLAERKQNPVIMVGDGVNDAPALAAADVGVAMGARGAAAAAEAADVVLLTDHLDRLLTAITVAQRSRKIALQSVCAGLGLSMTGMIAAALGYLSPVQGALTQELIDVAVVLNALRALKD